MDWQTFRQLPVEGVAKLVQAAGSKVCTFAVDGTRRWYLLEHPEAAATRSIEAFLQATWQRQIEIYGLLFDHGIETVLAPVTVPGIFERDSAYQRLIEPGFLWFCQNLAMVEFYRAYDVRVRIYGDTIRYFAETPYTYLLDAFADLTQQTADHQKRCLFYGIYTYDPIETVADIGVRFYLEHGRRPERREIVEAYYGEYVEPVSIYIGCDRPVVFDYPVNPTGQEDLYFMVNPSLYLDQETLRAILYDHLYMRPVSASYSDLGAAEREALAGFYRHNQGRVLGIGQKHPSDSLWYPVGSGVAGEPD